MRRYLGRLILTGAVAALSVTALAAWNMAKAPAEVDAKAQVQTTSFADELQPGKMLHRVQERYSRHGPMAGRVATNPCSQPERMYAESWIQVDQDGLASERWGRSTDVNGDAFMTSQTRDGESVYQWANCNKVTRIQYIPYSLQDWARRVEGAPQKLVDIGLEKVGEGVWDGKETAIYEIRYEYLPPRNATGYRLPYADDLKPLYILVRHELVVENPLIKRYQRWAVDNEGNKTLIYEKVTTLLEVTDP